MCGTNIYLNSFVYDKSKHKMVDANTAESKNCSTKFFILSN